MLRDVLRRVEAANHILGIRMWRGVNSRAAEASKGRKKYICEIQYVKFILHLPAR